MASVLPGQKNMPGPGPKCFAGALAPPRPGRKKMPGPAPVPGRRWYYIKKLGSIILSKPQVS